VKASICLPGQADSRVYAVRGIRAAADRAGSGDRIP
jgi:hypothetical protein